MLVFVALIHKVGFSLILLPIQLIPMNTLLSFTYHTSCCSEIKKVKVCTTVWLDYQSLIILCIYMRDIQ